MQALSDSEDDVVLVEEKRRPKLQRCEKQPLTKDEVCAASLPSRQSFGSNIYYDINTHTTY